MVIVEKILIENEGKTLEFKENILNLKGILKTVVSFSNTAGGRIVIGVRDNDRAVVGVLDPSLVEQSLVKCYFRWYFSKDSSQHRDH